MLSPTHSVKSFAERISAIEEEKRQLSQDIRDLYEEAKGAGIDAKALREARRRLKLDKAVADLADQYELALGGTT